MNNKIKLALLVILFQLSAFCSSYFASPTNKFLNFSREGKSIIISTSNDIKYKISPYGKMMIRIHAAKNNEDFLPDDHYEMVAKHNWNGNFILNETNKQLELYSDSTKTLRLVIQKSPLSFSFYYNDSLMLSDKNGIQYNGNIISESFAADDNEHFTGLGHGFYGKAESIDLKGTIVERNYGTKHGNQAPLVVPFYMSSKGYGIFMNSTFVNRFAFNKDKEYGFSIDDYGTKGQLDYFFICGPEFKSILDYYTQLTGRTFLPPLAFFGIGLSDKGNDHNSAHPSDEAWWKMKIEEQRDAGLAIDHIINDNRWRAGGGERCNSYFDWDETRYPDPSEYESWVKKNGLIVTIDFNRCIAMKSDGWKSSFNVPHADRIDFPGSAPDFTKKEVRDWFWKLFWDKSLNPELHFPGDALWIDEFDEYNPIDNSVKLGNGLLWAEMKNYWFFLISQSLVEDGWNKAFGNTKRPFVWIRGMTAGAQRYATLWTGDIRPTYASMKEQIISTQLAGLSGFPFEGHDQGGFYNYEKKSGPDAEMYQKWSMAMGAFTPFWKPHGVGKSRWPVDRTEPEFETAEKFIGLRYRLIPYIYSTAFQAYLDGTPMVRPMIWDYQNNPEAWTNDLQYMWGPEMLIVPNASENDSVDFWLPEGLWYDYWTKEKLTGSKDISYPSPLGSLVILVKAGSIIPLADPALSIAFINKQNLTLEVFPGADGNFDLYEDDGISVHYKEGKYCYTNFKYNDSSRTLVISKAEGSYVNAPVQKNYIIKFMSVNKFNKVLVNGNPLVELSSNDSNNEETNGYLLNRNSNLLEVHLYNIPLDSQTTIQMK